MTDPKLVDACPAFARALGECFEALERGDELAGEAWWLLAVRTAREFRWLRAATPT